MKVLPLFMLAAMPYTMSIRPDDISICDYYANRIFGVSNATTQLKLVTILVNTAIIGNYTQPTKLSVPGILARNATYKDTQVNLLPYFDGSLKSSNTGKEHGVAVNFLDGGGALPLKKSMPSDSNVSHQK